MASFLMSFVPRFTLKVGEMAIHCCPLYGFPPARLSTTIQIDIIADLTCEMSNTVANLGLNRDSMLSQRQQLRRIPLDP